MTIAASEHSVSFWPLTSRDRGQLVVALWVGLLLVVPLALHAPLYFYDLGRSLNGSYGWSEDGPLLADFVSQLLLMGAPRTVLTSPLDQLVVHSLVSTSQALGCSPGLHVPVRLALFHRKPVLQL